jgi:hypothetical protein
MSATAAPLAASARVQHQLAEVGRLVGVHERALLEALVQLQRVQLDLDALEAGVRTTPLDHPYRPELLRDIDEKRREVERLEESIKHLTGEAVYARALYSRLRRPRPEHRSDGLERRNDLLVGRARQRERRDGSARNGSRGSPDDTPPSEPPWRLTWAERAPGLWRLRALRCRLHELIEGIAP